jgi:hypothetical protein
LGGSALLHRALATALRPAAGKPSRTFLFRDEKEPINHALSKREDFADLLWDLVSQLWNEGNILGIEFVQAIRPPWPAEFAARPRDCL